MPKYSKERLKLIDEKIKSYYIRLPKDQRSLRNLSQLTGYDKNFIGKRLIKIKKEKQYRHTYYTLNEHLARFEDRMEFIIEELITIISDPKVKLADRISAMRELRGTEKEIFEKMFEAGIFEKKLGELDVNNKNLAENTLNSFISKYKEYKESQGKQEVEVVDQKAKEIKEAEIENEEAEKEKVEEEKNQEVQLEPRVS